MADGLASSANAVSAAQADAEQSRLAAQQAQQAAQAIGDRQGGHAHATVGTVEFHSPNS